MTDQTNDPVAAAAAQLEQQAAQPSSTEPSAPVVAHPEPTPVVVSAVSPKSPQSFAAAASDEIPNAAPAVAKQPAMQISAAPASTPSGIVGIVENSAAKVEGAFSAQAHGIRERIAAIKHHLNIRGFEQSAIADIHAELDAIEKWL